MTSKKLQIIAMLKELERRIKAIKADISLKEDKIDRIAPYPGQSVQVSSLRKEIKEMEIEKSKLEEQESLMKDSYELCQRIETLKKEVQDLNRELSSMPNFNKTDKIRYTIRLKSLEIQAIEGSIKKNVNQVKNVTNKK